MTVFETGATYSATSVCDHNCVWHYIVTRRTAKTVWVRLLVENERQPVKAFRISVYADVEQIFPSGRYSMAPILGADKKEN